MCLFFRGDNFCVAFSKLGTLRSIIPNHVNVLALTATSTQETFKCVKDRLAMKDVVLIGMHPGRPNIKYVVKPSIKVNGLSLLLTAELSEFRTKAPKTVILSNTFTMCQLINIFKKAFKSEHN